MFLINRLGDLFFPVSVNLIYFCLFYLIGIMVSRVLKISVVRLIDQIIVLTAGIVVVSFYYFGFGMLGFYNNWTVLVIPSGVGLISLIANRRIISGVWDQILFYIKTTFNSRLNWFLGILVIGFVLIFMIFSVLPDWGFDSNWYHLSQPLLYLRAGHMYHVGGFIFNAGFPQFWEMLYLPLLLIPNDLILPAFAVFTTLLLLLTIYLFGRQLKIGRWLLLFVIFGVILIPTVLRHANLAYIDTPLTLFVTLALYIAIRVENESNWQNIKLLSITLIPVACMKYSALFYLVAILLFTFFNLIKSKKSFWESIKIILIIGLPAGLGLGLWLLRNQVQVGWFLDPVGSVPLTNYTAGIYSTWPDFFMSRITNAKQIFAEYFREYTYLIYVITGLVVVLIYKKYWHYLLLGIICLFAWYFLMPPGNEIRYLLPVIPFGLLIFYQISPKWLSICACVLFLVTLPRQVVNANLVYQAYSDYAVGNKSINEYKNEVFVKEPLMFYDYTGNLKKVIGEDKVLTIDNHLILPTLEDFNCDEITVSPIKIEQLRGFADLAEKMRVDGYLYLFVNRHTLETRFKDFPDQPGDSFELIYYDDTYGNIRTAYRLVR